ncbi:SLAM family member 9-like isoform X2 [Rhineura floridana]|nr:SLAM family member 9-like isoform X2 [Rhineura floridana]XP_061461918.1 SLAM family member 9-like isoform X2 [Rhineura floridana]XP_061461919.1 SLAM family member 9-like isoform X2 [Rhineura floridana]
MPLLIAEFVNGELKRPNEGDRFGHRLEMADETTLRIKGLELEDTGVMDVRVRFATSAILEHSFNLAVHEPVPMPQISHRLISYTADECNMTLQCQTLGKGGLRLSWKMGNPLRVLEGALGWHRLTDTGNELHLSWRPTTSNSTITCLVDNPVDLKNTSVDLFNVCQDADEYGCFSWVRTTMFVGLGLQITIIVLVNILERKDWNQCCAGVDAGIANMAPVGTNKPTKTFYRAHKRSP